MVNPKKGRINNIWNGNCWRKVGNDKTKTRNYSPEQLTFLQLFPLIYFICVLSRQSLLPSLAPPVSCHVFCVCTMNMQNTHNSRNWIIPILCKCIWTRTRTHTERIASTVALLRRLQHRSEWTCKLSLEKTNFQLCYEGKDENERGEGAENSHRQNQCTCEYKCLIPFAFGTQDVHNFALISQATEPFQHKFISIESNERKLHFQRAFCFLVRVACASHFVFISKFVQTISSAQLSSLYRLHYQLNTFSIHLHYIHLFGKNTGKNHKRAKLCTISFGGLQLIILHKKKTRKLNVRISHGFDTEQILRIYPTFLISCGYKRFEFILLFHLAIFRLYWWVGSEILCMLYTNISRYVWIPFSLKSEKHRKQNWNM